MQAADRVALELTELREDLLAGNYAAFKQRISALQSGISALEADPPPDAALASLRFQARELQDLLAAAAAGLQAARSRLTEINQIRRGGGIYGGDGTRQQLSVPHSGNRRL